MAHRLIVRSSAESDIESAYLWYEDQREGLGAEFLDELDATLSRVIDNPNIYSEIERSIRRALVRRFPFGVYFIVTDDAVSIAGVFHTSRDPDSLRGRR